MTKLPHGATNHVVYCCLLSYIFMSHSAVDQGDYELYRSRLPPIDTESLHHLPGGSVENRRKQVEARMAGESNPGLPITRV